MRLRVQLTHSSGGSSSDRTLWDRRGAAVSTVMVGRSPRRVVFWRRRKARSPGGQDGGLILHCKQGSRKFECRSSDGTEKWSTVESRKKASTMETSLEKPLILDPRLRGTRWSEVRMKGKGEGECEGARGVSAL